MKKTVITILLVLPFVLMFIISFMAKIMSTYQYIYVDKVCFSEDGLKCINNPNYYILLRSNEEYDLKVIVYPELASNKNVSYASLNSEVAQVDENGKVTAMNYGVTAVTVETEDGKKTSTIIVKVSDEEVSSIDIHEETIEIKEKEEYKLTATIHPETALNKKVRWSSSDPSIAEVHPTTGVVKGISEGQVTITAKSIDGEFTDTCIVKVSAFEQPFDLTKNGVTIDTETYDISQLIVIYDSNIKLQDFTYNVIEGSEFCSKEGSVLTVQSGHLIKVEVEVTNVDYKPVVLIYRR